MTQTPKPRFRPFTITLAVVLSIVAVVAIEVSNRVGAEAEARDLAIAGEMRAEECAALVRALSDKTLKKHIVLTSSDVLRCRDELGLAP